MSNGFNDVYDNQIYSHTTIDSNPRLVETW